MEAISPRKVAITNINRYSVSNDKLLIVEVQQMRSQ